MIEQGNGNLLTAEVEALVNTVNTVGVMGKGIALQFKRGFPANFRAYRAACARGEVQLGRVWTFDTGVTGPRRYILNFPTKKHWRSDSRLEDISAGLDSLVDTVRELGVTSVAIPALGCGNGGLAWADVRPLIERACGRMDDVRAVIYPPEGAPPPEAMPNAMPRPSLNQYRALLLTAISRYLARARLQEVRGGISELEIQKLAYFLQVLGAPPAVGLRPGHVRPVCAGTRPYFGRDGGPPSDGPRRPIGASDRVRPDQPRGGECRRRRTARERRASRSEATDVSARPRGRLRNPVQPRASGNSSFRFASRARDQ
jgi:O-acetyl-ADP-ribose deacetylase (regulator of RNase III)